MTKRIKEGWLLVLLLALMLATAATAGYCFGVYHAVAESKVSYFDDGIVEIELDGEAYLHQVV